MTDKQQKFLNDLTDHGQALTNEWSTYWQSYSNMGTWQFWVNVIFIIAPLIVLVFALDRKKALRIGFYGVVIHLIATHVDLHATTHRYWAYPYKVFPFPPVSFALDASLIPVSYMLFYQWTLNRNKNYYAYLAGLAFVFAFLFKPLLSWLNFFKLYESTYLELFIIYFVGGLLGKWIIDLFHMAQKHSTDSRETARSK